MASDYFLPRHVYFCRRGEAFVFLDLRRDDYTLVGGHAAAALRVLSSKEQPDGSKRKLSLALSELLEGGLLTTDRDAGTEITPTVVELAMEHLVDAECAPDIHVTVVHIWRFVTACTKAAIRLRCERLKDTVEAVEQRKARHLLSGPIEIEKARELTAVFLKLRSIFPRNYLCLYDSLALIEFLAGYRMFPSWIFGIKLEPWAAHCWVQEGPFTFNEGVEEAAGYTPVMAV